MNITKGDKQSQLVSTARTTGFWYLIMAISGILGFMVFHPQVFDSDPQKTLKNLIDLKSLARTRVLFEFAIIISQALTAVWFYRLFKNINEWEAWTVAIWGMMNAVVIMISAISMASAIEIANSSILTTNDKILLILICQNFIANTWGVGGLFFGLWLLPMGYIVIKSKRMPIWLGRVIILGGIGYLISTFFRYLAIDFTVNRFLILPATIGEFWMIGYLLIFGIRPVHD